MAPLRLAILECDTPLPEVVAQSGVYGDQFKTLLDAAAQGLGRPELSPKAGDGPDGKLQVTTWDVVTKMEYPEIGDVDAVLMSGSKHDAFGDAPWIQKLVAFTQEALATNRIRIIGVCFGHQILGRALGAKVGRNGDTWEVAVNDIDLSEKGKQLFGKDKISLHQMHRDIVFEYPSGVEPLGSSPACEVQGMYAPKRLISVQGHPEFHQKTLEKIIGARHALGVFNDEQYKDGMTKAALPHDGVLVAQAFLKFLFDE